MSTSAAQLTDVRAAEARRNATAIGDDISSSRDVTVRRAAVRALARILDARALDRLQSALADEDGEVVTWAAYGLGYACAGREVTTVRALAVRAAALAADHDASGVERPLFDPEEAISDALGRCAGDEAERTLVGFLRGPKKRAEAAALGLGHIADRTGKLDDDTVVALLDAAEGQAVDNALYPLTRLTTLNASSAERARTLALATLSKHAPGAEFALRTLSRTGTAGQNALVKACADPWLSAPLRAQAARELTLLGERGRVAAWSAFAAVVSTPPNDARLASADYGVLASLVDGLALPVPGLGKDRLGVLALPMNDGDSPSVRRRKAHLRCAAATLLADGNYESARLRACDPAVQSRERDLATVASLGRAPLLGARKSAFLAYAGSEDDLVREAALGLLLAHPEVDESYRVLAAALASTSLGVVATAARILSSYPERADRGQEPPANERAAPRPDDSVVRALAPAYAAAEARHNVEVQGLLLDAMGALQILSFKSVASAACTSDNVTLREHAERALHLLGERARRCDAAAASSGGLVAALDGHERGRVRLDVHTDAAELTLVLDAKYAPNAVARIAHLAESGFYDGLLVHRVVPGFVAQLGDPEGDGYGNDGAAPLRCETAPLPFPIGAVGVALSGRDSGASQFFVTLGRYPHLDGRYAWIGEASPGWETLAVGDRVLTIRTSAPP